MASGHRGKGSGRMGINSVRAVVLPKLDVMGSIPVGPSKILS